MNAVTEPINYATAAAMLAMLVASAGVPETISVAMLDGSHATYELVAKPVTVQVGSKRGVPMLRAMDMAHYEGPCPGCHERLRRGGATHDEAIARAEVVAVPAGKRWPPEVGAVTTVVCRPWWTKVGEPDVVIADGAAAVVHVGCWHGRITTNAWTAVGAGRDRGDR